MSTSTRTPVDSLTTAARRLVILLGEAVERYVDVLDGTVDFDPATTDPATDRYHRGNYRGQAFAYARAIALIDGSDPHDRLEARIDAEISRRQRGVPA